jgi:hypothetical protein
MAAAVLLGSLVELGIWYVMYVNASDPLTARSYPLLDQLQQPGVNVAFFVAWRVWRHFHPPYPWTPYIGSACGLATLVLMWSIAVFAALSIIRYLRQGRPGLIQRSR